MKIQGVLFDLDGTLLDTAQDLLHALQLLSHTEQLPFIIEQNSSELRAAAGHGSKGLLKTGFGIDESHAKYTHFVSRFFTFYQQSLLQNTHLFPGMEKILDFLGERKIPWGIVTNKPHYFSAQLVDALGLSNRLKCLVSGDSLPQRKPHPAPILYACEQLDVKPENCAYVGDSETDVIASQAAGVHSIVALYGYISEKISPQIWNAEHYIQRPEELIDFLKTQTIEKN